jgi:hypothetical protein
MSACSSVNMLQPQQRPVTRGTMDGTKLMHHPTAMAASLSLYPADHVVPGFCGSAASSHFHQQCPGLTREHSAGPVLAVGASLAVLIPESQHYGHQGLGCGLEESQKAG